MFAIAYFPFFFGADFFAVFLVAVFLAPDLAAVFLPVLFMGGILGRLLHEFAVTIGAAILVSGLVSLTLTPMLCSRFLHPPQTERHGRFYNVTERGFDALLHGYDRTLKLALRHRLTVMMISAVLVPVISSCDGTGRYTSSRILRARSDSTPQTIRSGREIFFRATPSCRNSGFEATSNSIAFASACALPVLANRRIVLQIHCAVIAGTVLFSTISLYPFRLCAMVRAAAST